MLCCYQFPQILELEGNNIDQLEASTFSELINLDSLDLTNNVISEFVIGVFAGLEKLTVLNLGSNRIARIKANTFKGLQSLKELTLEDNVINTIDQYAFSGLDSLKSLYLNHNDLRSVPTSALRALPSLVSLQLTGNPLRKIEKYDFKGLDKIRGLWLDECELGSIAKKAFHNSKIRTLILSENNLTNLPNMGTLDRLERVTLDGNPWVCDCKLGATVRWVRRHKLTPPLPKLICTSPLYRVGTRATELTMDQLCSEEPYVPADTKKNNTVDYENTPIPVSDYSYNAYTYSEEDPSLPEGTWSKDPYDTEQLYPPTDSKMRETVMNTSAKINTTVAETTKGQTRILTAIRTSSQLDTVMKSTEPNANTMGSDSPQEKRNTISSTTQLSVTNRKTMTSQFRRKFPYRQNDTALPQKPSAKKKKPGLTKTDIIVIAAIAVGFGVLAPLVYAFSRFMRARHLKQTKKKNDKEMNLEPREENHYEVAKAPTDEEATEKDINGTIAEPIEHEAKPENEET